MRALPNSGTRAIRGPRPLALVAACLALSGCGPETIDCSADAVKTTLASMGRERVVQLAVDSDPAPARGAREAALATATRVAIEAPRLIEWEKAEGRLKCVADLVVEAPVGAKGALARTRTRIHYRVMSASPAFFMVEIAYGDLLNVFPLPGLVDTAEPASRARTAE